jgi:GDP-L-fucose synthase
VEVWGTGRPRREFLHVDDVASACVFLMERYDASEIINIGCGTDVSVGNLARLVGEIVGFGGEIRHNVSRPDGTPRKLLDVSRLFALGWRPTIELSDGLRSTYDWFAERLETRATIRGMETRDLVRGVDLERPLTGRRGLPRPRESDDAVTHS